MPSKWNVLHSNANALLFELKACTKTRNLKRGIQAHAEAVKCGRDSDNYVASALINMYAKCGSIDDARRLFDKMKLPDVVCWNALILGYAENGKGLEALELFHKMRSKRPKPNSVTFIAALKACSSLNAKGVKLGREIHDLAKANGSDSDIHVLSTLIDMYSKCGSMADARRVFNCIEAPNVFAWTALILGYADNGQGLTALDMFRRMRTSGPPANSVTFLAVLKACTTLALEGTRGCIECRKRGKEIHDMMVDNGCASELYVQSALIKMYAKCGSMVDAHQVFDCIEKQDVALWNVLIMGYTDNGQGHVALHVFENMKNGGFSPDSVTFTAVLKACGLVGGQQIGRKVHSDIEKGNHFDVVLVCCLVDFYAKCGSMAEAKRVFDMHVEARVTITWNALLAGFSCCGDHESVFRLFQRMQDTGFHPNSVTFLSILTCCSHGGLVEKGKECFELMTSKYELVPDIEHYNCMVDILGRANKFDSAMALLERMPCSADGVTWRTILDACHKWKNVEIGRLAFRSLIGLNDLDAGAYVVMGLIYRSRLMLEEHEMVMGLREQLEQAWLLEE